MGLLSGFLSDGSIAQISQCGSLAEPNAQKAIAKLKKSPKSSIPKLAEALQSTNKLGNTHGSYIRTEEGRNVYVRREEVALWGLGNISLGRVPEEDEDNLVQYISR